ncbi:aldo/keto reductase [Agrococcus sp. SL85]|uniref:aldo/keto reductase n=1 Tax=Agrococcus sp. SL85 TaxID=2995141 RepID=UPI00226CBBF8|nr:aldo/keto reductase [Agrococcus sp. SL85]WAC65809.1 aldo/keto reductase [Agrococcus sp. SL85]
MTNLGFGPLILGGNTFGWTSDRDESFAVLDAFLAAGGTAIDTADVYSAWADGNTGGESETILGEWLASRGHRDRVEIATKVSQHPQRQGLSAATVRAAVEDSLRRLRTDRIDLYYAHRDDEAVPQEEVLAAFDELVRAGKVREMGVSNFAPERIRSAVAIAERDGLVRPTVSQDRYNLVERGAEAELLPALAELGIVEAPYSSLASGFLTGKYRPGSEVDSVRAGTAGRYLQAPEGLAVLEALDGIAAAHGTSATAVSLAWLRQQPQVVAPIASARTPEQLVDLLASMRLELTAAELDALAGR